jgi:hypothetical protein
LEFYCHETYQLGDFYRSHNADDPKSDERFNASIFRRGVRCNRAYDDRVDSCGISCYPHLSHSDSCPTKPPQRENMACEPDGLIC